MFINLLQSDTFMVVLDESHYVKQLFQNKAAWANAVVLKISEFAKVRLISSGTPSTELRKGTVWKVTITFLLSGEHILGLIGKRFQEELNTDASKREMMKVVLNAISS